MLKLTKINKKKLNRKKFSTWSKNFDISIFWLSRQKKLRFFRRFSYGMYPHFVEQKKFFNLNTKKIFFNKADQKLRDPKKQIFG